MSLAMIIASLGFAASPAHATSYCSGWKQVQNFQEKACVITESSTTIRHRHYVRSLISNTQSTYVTTFRYINGSVSVCKSQTRETFSAYQTKSWSCGSYRYSGYRYFTRGYVTKSDGYNIGVDSPTITG
ncbi:MAG: hypothetical protein ACRDT4_25545 [Micromonosporaceae bacterium]